MSHPFAGLQIIALSQRPKEGAYVAVSLAEWEKLNADLVEARSRADYYCRWLNQIQNPPNGRWHFKVPSRWYGRLFLWLFKRLLNRGSYQLRLRGRSPKRRGIRRRFSYGIKLQDAKVWAVHIDHKEAVK